MSDSPQSSGHRKYSSQVTEGIERAASRGMLYGVGFQKSDFQKSQIGIASTWGMVTPCNMHINRLAEDAARGVENAGGTRPCSSIQLRSAMEFRWELKE